MRNSDVSAAATLPRPDPDAPVQVAPSDLVVEEAEPTRWYELGVLDGCPKQTINVGGARATFSKFRGNPNYNEETKSLVGPTTFPRQRLSKTEVETIREYVAKRVVLVAEGGTGNVYEKGHAALRGAKNVRPLAEFLVLRPLPESAITEPAPISMAGPVAPKE